MIMPSRSGVHRIAVSAALISLTCSTVAAEENGRISSVPAVAVATAGSSNGSVTLRWTASGDDGNIGTASAYDLRFDTDSITEASWDQATQVSGEPSPQPAGSLESFTMGELTAGVTYYFAIRAIDEVANRSPVSNNVAVAVEGISAAFSSDVTSGSAPLMVAFTDLSSGDISSWHWDFGDGGSSSLANPTHVYQAAGTYSVSLTVSGGIGTDVELISDYIVVTSPGSSIHTALSDMPVQGSMTGSYVSTQQADGVFEVITEELIGGNPNVARSALEHRWQFNIATGDPVVFHLQAHRPVNGDGDDFAFEYSIDNNTFIRLVTVDNHVSQMYSALLPATLSGPLYMRAVDTDGTKGNTDLASLFIDQMYIELSGDPPAVQVIYVDQVKVVRGERRSNRNRSEAEVMVRDTSGRSVPGVTVAGRFSGPTDDVHVGVTGPDGAVKFRSSRAKNAIGEWCFAVDEVRGHSAVHDPSRDLEISACDGGPVTMSLAPNYPNPFNARTEIAYEITHEGPARLEVYNVLGARVRVLVDAYLQVGEYSVIWDGFDESGREVASGTYFSRLSGSGESFVRAMTLLK